MDGPANTVPGSAFKKWFEAEYGRPDSAAFPDWENVWNAATERAAQELDEFAANYEEMARSFPSGKVCAAGTAENARIAAKRIRSLKGS